MREFCQEILGSMNRPKKFFQFSFLIAFSALVLPAISFNFETTEAAPRLVEVVSRPSSCAGGGAKRTAAEEIYSSASPSAAVAPAPAACLPPGGLGARKVLHKNLLQWAKDEGCACGEPQEKENLTKEEAECIANCIKRHGGGFPKSEKQVCEFLKKIPGGYDDADCKDIWNGRGWVKGLKTADCNGDDKIDQEEFEGFVQGQTCPKK